MMDGEWAGTGTPGSGEWGPDRGSTVALSDSASYSGASTPAEPYTSGWRPDAGVFPNSPLVGHARAPHSDFGGYPALPLAESAPHSELGAYPGSPLAMALHPEFGVPPPAHFVSSHQAYAEAYRMASFQAQAHVAPLGGAHEVQYQTAAFGAQTHAAAPLGGVRESQYQTAAFGALAAATPLGGVRKSQFLPGSFTSLENVHEPRYAALTPQQTEFAISGSVMGGPSNIAQPCYPSAIAQSYPSGIAQSSFPSGIAQSSFPSGIAQSSFPSGITQPSSPSGLISSPSNHPSESGLVPPSLLVAVPSGIDSSESGLSVRSGGSLMPGDALRHLIAEMDASPHAEARASLVSLLPRAAMEPRLEQARCGAGSRPLGVPEAGVGGRCPGFPREDTGGGAAQLSKPRHPNANHRSNERNCSLPPSPPPERVDGSTDDLNIAEEYLSHLPSPEQRGYSPQWHTAGTSSFTMPDTGDTVPRRTNGALLRGAAATAATALARKQRQQQPAANASASMKRRLSGPTRADASMLPLWHRSVPLVVRGNPRTSVAILAAAIFVNGAPPPALSLTYPSIFYLSTYLRVSL